MLDGECQSSVLDVSSVEDKILERTLGSCLVDSLCYLKVEMQG